MMRKAVILIGGNATRTYPLTLTKPKALLKVANKTMLSLLLDNLIGVCKEAILVVNYKKEMIREVFGEKYKSIKLSYVEQKQTNGTGDALLCAEKQLDNESFLLFYGDDFVSIEDVQKLCKEKYALLGCEIDNPNQYGVLETVNGYLKQIVEKPSKPISKLVNIGYYILDTTIFDYLKKVNKSKRGEYELTDAITVFAKINPMKVVTATTWQPITYPWHLLNVNKSLLSAIVFKNRGKIEPGCTIHGPVQIGKGTVVKSGVYIEGPVIIGENCKIGPNCYIRPATTIGDSVKIGNAVEVKNSIIGDHTNIGHLSYVGDSIVGDHVNFGAGTIAANLRHDGKNMKSLVKDKLVDTGLKKLGVIIGDNVHTGIHTSIYPARKLWANVSTVPGEIVTEDIKDEFKYRRHK